MKILLTGSTGYIGRRLLPVLIEDGHHVVCMVRDKHRFDIGDLVKSHQSQITIVEADLSNRDSLVALPKDIDAAFYLVHAMGTGKKNFKSKEEEQALNFVEYIDKTVARQIIYLGGITNDAKLSDHLASRSKVEQVLKGSRVPATALRAAIIIGSGSASFEIIRDLVEKLPVMIAPRWLSTKCQPIGIRNVIEYLRGVLLKEEAFNRTFDIGGTDILSYHEMLMTYAKVRKLKRWIIPVPVLSPNLSSLWLYFVTSTSMPLARSLVSSLRNEVICRDDDIQKVVQVNRLSYEASLRLAFERIEKHNVISSWTDAFNSRSDINVLNNIDVPTFGCFHDKQKIEIERPVEDVIENIWRIGGRRGWYVGNWMWIIRGFLDKLAGGVGLRRGRRSETDLKSGDALDFWRVLIADKKNGRLLLYAEMKLPGEAWLEFRVVETDGKPHLVQTATFRPLGVWGRVYWYLVLPFHGFIFPRMAARIAAFGVGVRRK